MARMDAHRYQQVKTILADLLERPAHERAGLLTARCGQDADLRAEIESLLAYESGDDFLVPGEARDALMRDRTAPAQRRRPLAAKGGACSRSSPRATVRWCGPTACPTTPTPRPEQTA